MALVRIFTSDLDALADLQPAVPPSARLDDYASFLRRIENPALLAEQIMVEGREHVARDGRWKQGHRRRARDVFNLLVHYARAAQPLPPDVLRAAGAVLGLAKPLSTRERDGWLKRWRLKKSRAFIARHFGISQGHAFALCAPHRLLPATKTLRRDESEMISLALAARQSPAPRVRRVGALVLHQLLAASRRRGHAPSAELLALAESYLT